MNENSIDCIFVIDESGSLGYAKNQEKFPGEFGLVAGYFLPFSTVEKAKEAAKPFFAEFRKNDDEKIHITDLPRDKQDQLRKKVFEIFECHNFLWLYGAIYVQGAYEFYYEPNEKEEVVQVRKEKIHTRLFYSIILKALALIKTDNKTIKKVNMLIVSDKLDKGVIKDFKNEIKMNHFLLTTRQETKNFKKQNDKGKIETFRYTTNVIMPDSCDFQFDELNLDISTDVSDVTLIADVLTNSAFYYLTQKIKDNPNIRLNSKEAIEMHPLAHRVWGNQGEDPLDDMFRRKR